jgi:hypothetical protein
MPPFVNLYVCVNDQSVQGSRSNLHRKSTPAARTHPDGSSRRVVFPAEADDAPASRASRATRKNCGLGVIKAATLRWPIAP